MAKNTPNQQGNRSLSEVHESVVVPSRGPWWRRWLAITGPALMAAVGYMDPGNWATDIAGGSRYNYTLIWVLLMSNLMAILLQSLAARLGIVSRRDLAQVCHEEVRVSSPPWRLVWRRVPLRGARALRPGA